MKLDEVAEALRQVFASPNVLDSNLEPANLVDVIHGAGRQQGRVADAILDLSRSVALVAGAIEKLAERRQAGAKKGRRTGIVRRAVLAFFAQRLEDIGTKIGTPKLIAEWCAAYGATISSDAINAELRRGDGERYRNVGHGKYSLYRSMMDEATHCWNWWVGEYIHGEQPRAD